MSHDDFDLRDAAARLNNLSAQLLEVGRSTPLGSLAGTVARLTSGLKPTASLGLGIAVGSIAVLAVSAFLKGGSGGVSGEPADVPAEGFGAPAAPAPGATAHTADGATQEAAAAAAAPGTEQRTADAADTTGAAAAAPARTRAKAAPRRKSRKPAEGTS